MRSFYTLGLLEFSYEGEEIKFSDVYNYMDAISKVFEKELRFIYYHQTGFYFCKHYHEREMSEYEFAFLELYYVDAYINIFEKLLSFYYDREDFNYISKFENFDKAINHRSPVANEDGDLKKKVIFTYIELIKTKDFLREKLRIYEYSNDLCAWGTLNVKALKLFYNLIEGKFINPIGFHKFFSIFSLIRLNVQIETIDLINYPNASFGYLLNRIKPFFLNHIQNNYEKWISDHITFKGGRKKYKGVNQVINSPVIIKPIHRKEINSIIDQVEKLYIRQEYP